MIYQFCSGQAATGRVMQHQRSILGVAVALCLEQEMLGFTLFCEMIEMKQNN
jgi:hypothetical protein